MKETASQKVKRGFLTCLFSVSSFCWMNCGTCLESAWRSWRSLTTSMLYWVSSTMKTKSYSEFIFWGCRCCHGFFSFFQFSNLLWRPSSSSTPQSERANLLSGTRGRANFLTLKTNLHHFPQPLLHLPHLHLWTHSFQENLPPCTSLPIFHLTHKNSSDLLVSSEDFCKIGCSPLFFWFVADLSFFQKPTALCWTRSCASPPLTWLMDPLQS